MESRYKERAKELCSSLFEEPCDWEDNSIESDFLILMCQLAEEVEKVYRDPLMFGEEGSIQRVYTKAYVEELLQKQRELCSEQAEPCMEFDGYKDYPSVDKDSILNAKLKINEC